jgi:hypothetical protein
MVTNYMEHGGAGRAWDELAMIPAPPGTSLGGMSSQNVLAEVASSLQLSPLGIYTPWASRTGDMSWEEIKNPDTNIAVFGITDDQVNAVAQMTGGSPLPFVVIITKNPMTQAAVAAMWDGTAYQPYETQAVYRQDDAKDIPTIAFLHWGERIDMAALPKQTLALGPRASAVGGALLFAAQVPAQGTTTRGAPVAPSFQSALDAQMVAQSPPPAPPPPVVVAPPPPPPPEAQKQNMSVPIAVGLGAAVLGYMLWNKRPRRASSSSTALVLARNRRR